MSLRQMNDVAKDSPEPAAKSRMLKRPELSHQRLRWKVKKRVLVGKEEKQKVWGAKDKKIWTGAN